MRNAGWKRLLAMVLVLMMTLSLMPAAFADGDVECTMGEDCPAAVHNEGCPAAPKVEVEEVVVTCTGAEGCPATVHNAGCPAAPKVEVEEVVVTCTGAEGCPATVHSDGCPAVKKAEVEEVKTCTGAADCPATVHSEGCLAVKKTEVEDEDKDEDKVKACAITVGCTLADGHEGDCVLKEKEDEDEVEACTLTVGCTLAAGHEGDCVLKEKEDGDEDEVEACTLTVGCTLAAGHEGDCVLKEKEDEDEDDEPSAAVQAFLDAVAAIVIPENPEEMDEDSYAALEAQIEVAYDALEALSDEELEREDVLAACAIMSAAMDILYGEITPFYETYYPIVTIVPAGHPELEPIVSVGDSVGGGTVTEINGATILVQCEMDGGTGSTETFRLPYANSLWNISTYKVSGITWGGQGGSSKTEGASAGLSSGGCSAYYYFDYVTPGGGESENYLWTFILKYDANGGKGAPPTQTYGTNDKYTKSFTFTISNTIPTREGYIFKGWKADNNRIFQPGGSYLVSQTASGYNGGSVTKTLTAIWEAAPTYSYKVNHVYRTNGVEDGTCPETINNVASGTTVNLSSITKRTVYNSNTYTYTDGSPESAIIEDNSTVFTLYYDRTKAPTASEVENLLANGAVTVDCVNADAGHADKTYGLLTGSYNIGEVVGDATSGYFCTITVNADPYVAAYNDEVTPVHSIDGDTSKTITLKYTASGWEVATDLPVTFTVKCVTPPTPTGTPDAPDAGKLPEELGNVILVQCVNDEATHETKDKPYALLAGSFGIGAVTGDDKSGYFCEVTVNAAPYVTAYNTDVASGHSLVTDDPNSQKFTLKYSATDSTWSRPNPDGPAATFTVECEDDEITSPVKPTENAVKTLLGEAAVTIDCVNTGVSHGDETYGLIDGSFTVGDVEGNKTDGYTCTVTIQAAEYVAAYNNDVASGHSLATGEDTSKTITLAYDEDAATWTVPANAAPVVFQVVCSPSQPDTDWSKLTITKTVSPTGTVMPGDTVTYTITVTNNTGKHLYDITVSEVLDSRLELISANADKGSYDFTNGIWSFPTGMGVFTNGSSATLTITAKVKADATGTINNTATITGAGDGGNGLPQGSGGSSSVSITVGTPAPMNKFTLSYNANGGKGAPSSQSVETTAKIVVMTVSSVQPTRDGYHFCGWALTPNGHVSYRPGNEITLTGDVTLYAVWATPTSSPQTGDSSNMALWAAMAGMSLAAGAVVLFVLKKRKAE